MPNDAQSSMATRVAALGCISSMRAGESPPKRHTFLAPPMPAPTRTDHPASELPRELIDLGKRIAALPEEHYRELEQSYVQVVDCVRRRRRILELVQEALSQLRLDIKYLMFDLDVTRKERDELRAQLDHSEHDGQESY